MKVKKKFELFDQSENMTDFEKLEHIIDALEYLKEECVSTSNEDVTTLIESLFNITLVVFVNAMKSEYINKFNKD